MAEIIFERFFAFLLTADGVTVFDSHIITEWQTASITGNKDNEVVRFAWIDGESDLVSLVLTEGGIASGMFDSDGKFVCEDHEGDKVEIRFYELDLISNPDAGKKAAERFMEELQASVETLTGIADEHGARTLSDLMYLYSAILSGGFIEHFPDASRVLDVVKALPSGEVWASFIRGVEKAPKECAPNITEILQHRIEWRLSGDDAPAELDKCSIEHIEKMIREGYIQGELCVLGNDGETEYRGWWSIGK